MSVHIASIIARALSQGFTAKSILQHITRNFPQYAGPIAHATTLGYAADKILKHLVNPKEKNSDDAYLTESEKTDKSDRERKKKAAIGLGAAGLAAIGGMAGLASLAGRNAAIYPTQILPALAQQRQLPAPIQQAQLQLNPLNPPSNTPPQPQPTPSPMIQTPGQQIGQMKQTPESPEQIAQAAQAMPSVPEVEQVAQQPQEITQETIETTPELQPEFDYLKKKNLIPRIQTMLKAGKSKEKIVEFLKNKIPLMEQEYLRSLGKEIGQAGSIDEKLSSLIDRFFPQEQPKIEPKEEIKPEKGSEVLTPSGIGTIKGEDPKGFLIESEGKTTKIPKEEAITSPIPEKDIADIYTELVSKIPESERSSMINVAGYDPNFNEFIFMPHDGALYVYKDIPKEFAEKIKKALFQAKTTGSNFYGAWSEGEESRGAGLSALIKELQKLYGGKGKEYVRKYEKVYDFFALPKAAVKEREKREREERKRRKQGSR